MSKPKTEEEIVALPWAERRAHEWCRCCRRTRAELGPYRLATIGARWYNGLPPHGCDDCYGYGDGDAETRQMGLSALD